MDTNPLSSSAPKEGTVIPESSKKTSAVPVKTSIEKKAHEVGSSALQASSSSSGTSLEVGKFRKAFPSQSERGKRILSIPSPISSAPSSASSSDMDVHGNVKPLLEDEFVDLIDDFTTQTKAHDFKGEVVDSDPGIETVKLLMAKKDGRETFVRDVSRADRFSINQKSFSTARPSELLSTLKEALTEQEAATIPQIFHQSIFDDIRIKLSDLQAETDVPLGGGQSGEESWDVSISEKEIKIQLKRSFEFKDENIQTYGIVAVKREVTIDRTNLSNIQVKDQYSAFHPVQEDLHATAMSALQSLDQKSTLSHIEEESLENPATESVSLRPHEVRPKLDALIDKLSAKERLWKSKIRESTEPIQKEVFTSHLKELQASIKALKKFDFTTKIFERAAEYEKQESDFLEAIAKTGIVDEKKHRAITSAITKSESVAKKRAILEAITHAEDLLKPIEGFQGVVIHSSSGTHLFQQLITGKNLEGKKEEMKTVSSESGEREIPLQFYKDLRRVRELNLDGVTIPYKIDEEGNRIEMSDDEIYDFVQQLDPIFQGDLISVLHGLQQGLRSDIVYVLDNLQTVEAGMKKWPPGGRNNLDISIVNEGDQVVIRLDSCYQLRQEDLETEELYPYGLIAVRREVIIPKNQGKIELQNAIVKDFYSPFNAYDGRELGNRDAQIMPAETQAFKSLNEFIDQSNG